MFIDSFYLNIIYLSNDNPFLRENIFKNLLVIFHEKGSFINSVAWSLDFQLRWYMLIPIIFFIKNIWNKRIKSRKFIIFLITIYFLIEIVFLYYGKHVLLIDGFRYNFILGESLFYFIPGYLLYEIFTKFEQNGSKKHYLIALLILFIALISPDTPLYIYFIIAAYFCFNINYSNNVDKILGNISYPVFILHLPLMLPIYLQINKYIELTSLGEITSYYAVYILTILILIVISYLMLIIVQYPIDRYRSKKN